MKWLNVNIMNDLVVNRMGETCTKYKFHAISKILNSRTVKIDDVVVL